MAQGLLFRNEQTKGWMTDDLSNAEFVKSGYTSAGSFSAFMSMVLYGVPDYIFEEQLSDVLTSANLSQYIYNNVPGTPTMVRTGKTRHSETVRGHENITPYIRKV